jgi:hypothetical protein
MASSGYFFMNSPFETQAPRPMTGYSGTPLPKKLGIKPNFVVAVLNPPETWPALLGELPEGAQLKQDLRGTRAINVIIWFIQSRAELRKRLSNIMQRMNGTGSLWVAWPKRASKIPTDLTENVLREECLPTGLVDTKVCAIDEKWSGLRFVFRSGDMLNSFAFSSKNPI